MNHHTTSITPTAPFSFDLTASFTTNFQEQSSADSYIDGVYSRLLDIRGKKCLIKVGSIDELNLPNLWLEIKSEALDDLTIFEATKQASQLLGTHQDLKPFYLMAEKEPFLKDLIHKFNGLHLPQTASVWEGLVSAILGQQISAHVAKILRFNLVHTYGTAVEEDVVTHYTFPEPEAIASIGVEGLQAIKLSKNKSKYIVDIAKDIVAGELDLEKLRACSDEDIVKHLTRIRGIGPWSANWMLIRSYDRPDAFPAGDLILRRMVSEQVGEGNASLTPREAMKISERWSPFRSYVTTYLFAALRSGYYSK